MARRWRGWAGPGCARAPLPHALGRHAQAWHMGQAGRGPQRTACAALLRAPRPAALRLLGVRDRAEAPRKRQCLAAFGTRRAQEQGAPDRRQALTSRTPPPTEPPHTASQTANMQLAQRVQAPRVAGRSIAAVARPSARRAVAVRAQKQEVGGGAVLGPGLSRGRAGSRPGAPRSPDTAAHWPRSSGQGRHCRSGCRRAGPGRASGGAGRDRGVHGGRGEPCGTGLPGRWPLCVAAELDCGPSPVEADLRLRRVAVG